MFDVDLAVLQWRRDLGRGRVLTGGDLDELEDHLRAAYDMELELDPALPPARAFAHAVEVLGAHGELTREFAKVSGKGWRRLLNAGRALYVTSFFLPVAHYGITLAHPSLHDGLLPGIQALLLSVGMGGTLGLLSGLTNVGMLAIFTKLGSAKRTRVLTLAAALLAAHLFNYVWVVTTEPVSDLYVGYWAWLASFGLAGAGLALRARELPAEVRAGVLA